MSAAVTALRRDGLLTRADPPGVDRPRAERAVRELLAALGKDVRDGGLRDTPRRVAAAYAELVEHVPVSLTTFPNEAGYDELVVVRDIRCACTTWPTGVGVVVEDEHLCMSPRGVQKPGTRTTTPAMLGLLRDDARTRQEFLALIKT